MTTATKEYNRKWYAEQKKNPIFMEQRKEITNRRVEKLRKLYRGYKETLSCCMCGESCSVCLDFHHTDPTKKDLDVSILVHQGHSWEKIMNEISKCIVVCRNCHAKIHANLTTSS